LFISHIQPLIVIMSKSRFIVKKLTGWLLNTTVYICVSQKYAGAEDRNERSYLQMLSCGTSCRYL